MQKIRTILADDQHIFITGLKKVLTEEAPFPCDIIATAFDGHELLRIVQREKADLLILDLNLPGKDGLEVLKELKKASASLRILVLSRYDDSKIIKSAFKTGIDGYILKDKNVSELFTAMQEVLNGHTFIGDGVVFYSRRQSRPKRGGGCSNTYAFQDSFLKKHHLTKRETEVLRLITEALSNKEIAEHLFISDQTVSVHRKNIMRKLGVSNTAALIKTAYEHSLV